MLQNKNVVPENKFHFFKYFSFNISSFSFYFMLLWYNLDKAQTTTNNSHKTIQKPISDPQNAHISHTKTRQHTNSLKNDPTVEEPLEYVMYIVR